jgi:glucose/arabinose dehydrogenase
VKSAASRAIALAVVVLAVAAFAPAASAGDGPGYHLEPVANGFLRPTFVTAHTGANTLYVAEQRGTIQVLRRDSLASPWTKAGIFLDIRSLVTKPGAGRGLMGMAFHPNYRKNGLFYVHYTRRSSTPANVGDIVIAEYRRSTNLRARPTGRTVVVFDHPTIYHTGGWMGFGRGGLMYVTIGDAAQTAANNGQNLDIVQGKVLRFNPRKADGVSGFVPADNPFVGTSGHDLIWAYGMRHPWRASFDRGTGDIWIGDAGQNEWEEVTRFAPGSTGNGANLGWNMCEGSHAFPAPAEGPVPCAASGVVGPTIEYGHDAGRCSVIGGYVYRGIDSSSLFGRYLFGDYCTGEIWAVPSNYSFGSDLGTPLDTNVLIATFGEDARGEVYVIGTGGALWRIAQD